METYSISKKLHCVYELSEAPKNLKVIDDWRDGSIGDWVKTDDMHVMQVIRKGSMLNQGRYHVDYIGTCTGTFIVNDNTYMDSRKHRNIYSFSGKKTPHEIVESRKEATTKETIFAKYIAFGDPPETAYLKAFGTSSKKYAKIKAFQLLKTERVMTKITEAADEVMEQLGIDAEYLLGTAKEIVDMSEVARDRLNALKMLYEVAGLGKQEKHTTITGAMFQGFNPENIPELELKKKEVIDGEIKKLSTKSSK